MVYYINHNNYKQTEQQNEKKQLKILLNNLKQKKQVFRSTIKTSLLSLAKMLLLNKLQKMRFFKPISLIIKVFLKWSAYTSIFSLIFSIVSKRFSLQFDLTFWFDGIWLVISEGLMDYVIESGETIVSHIKRLFAKVYYKLGSDPKTIDQAKKLKGRYRVLSSDELNDVYSEMDRRENRNKTRPAPANDWNTERQRSLRRDFVGTSTPNYYNPDNYNHSYWNYAYCAAAALTLMAGGSLIYAYLKEDTATVSYYWDKVKGGFNYIFSYVPDIVNNFVLKKIWPFGHFEYQSPDGDTSADGSNSSIWMVNGVDITAMSMKDLKQYIIDNVTAKISTDFAIRRYYKYTMCRDDYDDANRLKEVVEYYLIELDKADSQTNSFSSDNNMREF
uniref:Uncharacterized protein n=1 Tax=Porodaedalea pini TaxID=108901 RepID=A0A5B9R8Z3_9AGAM|nr:hypothetical protein PPIT_000070 [Porodaedalea pini]QEG56951.1 hypothetical protein PPIT_000070 [Porodaedalea pini]